ncbi:unnamed protein product [Phyllotreta striolata]|uniref:2-aminoethanethiol dioxygenase n=1 Tax=Phyllotreta striolata TaxID=444603 RepID=A0A9N9XKR3_PHYSR|nr:unnamed protein product [Phyllotreta striolata]
MASLIQSILQQSLVTFRSDPASFSAQMTTLAGLVEKITAEDLNFDIAFASAPADSDPTIPVAPITYIHIFQDGVLSIGIFVLKADKTIPLHNHPDMYGLVKVLSGKVKIDSYSLNTTKTREITNQETTNVPEGVVPKNIFPAECNSSEVCDSLSKPCLLEPHNKNIHEIRSVDGAAAFLHVLAPPYAEAAAAAPEAAAKRCSFYAALRRLAPEVVLLQEIECPSW